MAREVPQRDWDDAKEKLKRYIEHLVDDSSCGWVGPRPAVWQVACDVGRRSTWQLECQHGIRGCRYGGTYQGECVGGQLGSRWAHHIEDQPERLPDCAKCLRKATRWCKKDDRRKKREAKAEKRRQGARPSRNLPVPVQVLFGLASLLGLIAVLWGLD